MTMEKIIFNDAILTQLSPTTKSMVEPMGEFITILAGIYPVEVRNKLIRPKAILIRGGISSFEDIVTSNYYYMPFDAIVPGLLQFADIKDVINCNFNNKTKIIAEDIRNAQNQILTKAELHRYWGKLTPPEYSASITDTAIKKVIKILQ
jgi:hypothetical protein